MKFLVACLITLLLISGCTEQKNEKYDNVHSVNNVRNSFDSQSCCLAKDYREFFADFDMLSKKGVPLAVKNSKVAPFLGISENSKALNIIFFELNEEEAKYCIHFKKTFQKSNLILFESDSSAGEQGRIDIFLRFTLKNKTYEYWALDDSTIENFSIKTWYKDSVSEVTFYDFDDAKIPPQKIKWNTFKSIQYNPIDCKKRVRKKVNGSFFESESRYDEDGELMYEHKNKKIPNAPNESLFWSEHWYY